MEDRLKQKKILLGITGSIAAYKSIELLRLLKGEGAEVRIILSKGATAFVAPLCLQVLSGNQIYQALFNADRTGEMAHIALARWADLLLIAPASAHCIAKLAQGFADDLLSTVCLATTAPIVIVPAMNTVMWSNAATLRNYQILIQRKIKFWGPQRGVQACGDSGEGRMLEPLAIMDHLARFLGKISDLIGKKILITAGPTQENIDPVRYITNRSSGKMGYAIAEAAAHTGAEVVLVSGPTSLTVSGAIKKIDIISAQNMYDAVMQQIAGAEFDLFIAAAAVVDYRPKHVYQHKFKKHHCELDMKLIPNIDIVSAIPRHHSKPIVVGFAAETQNLIEYAKLKLEKKNLDIIVANRVDAEKGFGSDFNELYILTRRTDEIKTLPFSTKHQLATKLIEVFYQYMIEADSLS